MIHITFMYVSGNTFRIPDSIMGLTFLAAGMSVPEAVSSVIVTNQGIVTLLDYNVRNKIYGDFSISCPIFYI